VNRRQRRHGRGDARGNGLLGGTGCCGRMMDHASGLGRRLMSEFMKVYLHENPLEKNSFSFSRVFTDPRWGRKRPLYRP
jgi:hypothetical protein